MGYFNSMATSKSFIKANSQSELGSIHRKLDRLDSLRGGSSSISEPLLEDTFGPLSNVRYNRCSSAPCRVAKVALLL